MVEAVSTNEVPGPKQPPRIHGDGCTCGDFARYGCPAAATYKPTASQEALTKDQEPKCIHFGKKTTGGFVQLGQAVPWACPWCHIASLTARCRQLEGALQAIVVFGHGEGHGRGFTCANMAQRAIDAALSQGAKP